MKNLILSLLIMSVMLLQDCMTRKTTGQVNNPALGVIDHASKKGHFLTYDSFHRTPHYYVYYNGKASGKMRLSKEPIYPNYPYAETALDNCLSGIKIQVDTSVNVNDVLEHSHWDKNSNKKITDSLEFVKAFPIYISNISDSGIFIGLNDNLRLSLRAKDPQGQWHDIEIDYRLKCGMGARKIVIKPKEVLVSKVRRYKGNFRTECKIVLYSGSDSEFSSNSYFDYINENQLTDRLLGDYAPRF